MSVQLRGGCCGNFIASSGDSDYFETTLLKFFLHFDSSNITDLTPRWLFCPRHGHFQHLYFSPCVHRCHCSDLYELLNKITL
jgi:hypothetical protein